jgi:hypothetical protein
MEVLVRFHCSTELAHQEHWESCFEDPDSMLGGMMELIFFYPDSMPGVMMGLIFSYVLHVLLQGPATTGLRKVLATAWLGIFEMNNDNEAITMFGREAS